MGHFSFKTSDTKKAIKIGSGPVHLITEDGRVFTEEMYGGYGDFGGTDIYALIAEMNGYTPEMGRRMFAGENDEFERKRYYGIHLVYNTGITNGTITYKADRDFRKWSDKIHEGKSPNDLIEEGWTQTDYKTWKQAARNGVKLPKLVKELPPRSEWKKVWDSLPYPENDPRQGS